MPVEKIIHPLEFDYIDLIDGKDKPPYKWVCSKCKQVHIFRRPDSFRCPCGHNLKFRFYYEG